MEKAEKIKNEQLNKKVAQGKERDEKVKQARERKNSMTNLNQ